MVEDVADLMGPEALGRDMAIEGGESGIQAVASIHDEQFEKNDSSIKQRLKIITIAMGLLRSIKVL